MLTPKQEAFCVARARPDCHSDADAYRAAYNVAKMKPDTISRAAHELVMDPKISTRVRELALEYRKPILFEVADVLREWVTIATADPSELSRTRHLSCRHCWGIDHAYHWKNDSEFANACAAVMDYNANKPGKAKERPFPSDAGGYGFRKLRGPHADCLECDGEGVLDTYVADILTVSPAARKLFAGIKQTASGIEIKTRDQDGAILNLAKYFGMHTDTLRVLLPLGATATINGGMTPEEAAKIYQAEVLGGV